MIIGGLFVAGVVLNQTGAKFTDLDQNDQQVLIEYEKLAQSTKKQGPLWEGYDLTDQPLVFINQGFGKSAYVVNPKQPVSKLWAKEIKMPAKYNTKKVYRISSLTPKMIWTKRTLGNFNTIGEKIKILGQNVYCLQYGSENLQPKYSANHFAPYLAHEAFHYYMQNNWSPSDRFDGELSQNGIKLLKQEYAVLSQIKAQLAHGSHDKLFQLADNYVAIVKQRLVENPDYVQKELTMATIEGTASYVGIQAAQRVGYDYGVMYFDNVKNVDFNEVIPMLEKKGIDRSFLRNRMPYETGALVCELLAKLNVPHWQQKLNQQTIQKQVTLYDVLKDYVATP
ncbi:hypothetical protein IV53_GL000563 [Ligilactobacillus ceti DSM 22408]|uniref:Uncharacterized protein n=1 Tax=Ligilactobacillus ceti DSM 22408 TaxID=1122146 RepID=A0A0R2KLJ7_9LACO|nr:hypothetical protein IV53_GL000563 [Ligilactobacillus ceti DSM 22408]